MSRKTRKSDKSAAAAEVEKVNNNAGDKVQKKVFFLHEKLLVNGNEIKRLRHPGSGNPVTFVISKKDKLLYEIYQFDQPNRSWLIDESISSNGKCYMAVTFDMTFLALYYLRKHCTKQACPLDQLDDPDYPYISEILLEFCEPDLIGNIADVKTFDNITAYKYNNEKCLAWLALKTKHLAETLKERNIHCGSSALSANYLKSDKINQADEQDFLRYACGLIGNYLEEELADELLKYFSIAKETICSKRKSTQGGGIDGIENDSKKFKVEDNDVTAMANCTNVLSKEKEKKISTKEKALAKAAKGTKNISSFFKK